MHIRLGACALISLLMGPASAFAASLTITNGDDDCFGRNETVCGDGTIITAPAATFSATGINPFPGLDLSTALDPAGTDVFAELGPQSFAFGVSLDPTQQITAATLSVKVWGLDLSAVPTGTPGFPAAFGDAFEGARMQFNGADIGTYFSAASPGSGPDRIEIVQFALAPTSILNGINTFTLTPEQDFLPFANDFFTGRDAYSIDFARLSLTTQAVQPPMNAVPLPAGLPLLLGGAAMLALLKRRRRT